LILNNKNLVIYNQLIELTSKKKMGFGEDVTMYFFNWCVYWKQIFAIWGCFQAGGWGLFFDDDDGAFMLWCYELFGGMNVKYPAYYYSNYAADASEQ
jgi:hypothetical protein